MSSDSFLDVLNTLSAADRGFTFVSNDVEECITYRDLRERTRSIGGGYQASGLEPGDRVLLVARDHRDFALSFLGALWAGLVPVPIAPPVVIGALRDYADGLTAVAAACHARMIVSGSSFLKRLSALPDDIQRADLEVLEQRGGALRQLLQLDEVAYLQMTSGTTGKPRAVRVTHASLLANASAITRHLQIDGTADRAVSWLPMYHDMGIVGFMLAPMLTQVPVWYLRTLQFARKPASWCDLISGVGGSISFGPTFAYRAVADAMSEPPKNWDLSAWRVAGCGAEPIHAPTLVRFCEQLAPAKFSSDALMPSYGMAEATLAMSMAPLATGLRRLRVDAHALRAGRIVETDASPGAVDLVSCGPALPGHEFRIVQADGKPAEDYAEGSIEFRGPSVTGGYLAGPADAVCDVHSEGWLRTGDLGFLHDDDIYVTGRKKDVIIVNGRNHHAQDIEWCLLSEPGINDGRVVAFGCPNNDFTGEGIVVAFEPAAGDEIDGIEDTARIIRRRVREHIGVVIEDVVAIRSAEFLRTTSGKPRRAELRTRYIEGRLGRQLTGAS
jgi:fatty-acyl-CoA synthase